MCKVIVKIENTFKVSKITLKYVILVLLLLEGNRTAGRKSHVQDFIKIKMM